MTAATSRRAALVLLAVAGAAATSGLVVQELAQEERDRHAVQELMRYIERKIPSHDGTAWLLTERAFAPGEARPALEPAHERLLADLDRLAHVEDLRLFVREVEIDGDVAQVDYRVEGSARRGDRPPPSGGRFTFRRAAEGWVLEASRFDESLPQPGAGTPGGKPVRHVHRWQSDALAVRLFAIAGLATHRRRGLAGSPMAGRAVSAEAHAEQRTP